MSRVGRLACVRALRATVCGRSNDCGSALTIVMFPLLIVTLVAANLTAATRTDLLVNHNVDDALRRLLAADAVMSRAMLDLLKGTSPGIAADGRVTTTSFNSIDVKLSVTRESAKVNLNEVPNPALRNLLTLSCVPSSTAQSLADAVADYVDDDDVPRAHGLEKAQYAAFSHHLGPRNGRLQTLGEVRRVPGMSFEIFERVRPFVTVYAFNKTPDLRFAAEKTVRAVLAADADTAHSGIMPLPAGEPPHVVTASEPFVGIVTLTAWTTVGGVDQPAVVQTAYLTGSRDQPIVVLDRQRDVIPDASNASCEDAHEQ